jgi:hypothetical protein
LISSAKITITAIATVIVESTDSRSTSNSRTGNRRMNSRHNGIGSSLRGGSGSTRGTRRCRGSHNSHNCPGSRSHHNTDSRINDRCRISRRINDRCRPVRIGSQSFVITALPGWELRFRREHCFHRRVQR